MLTIEKIITPCVDQWLFAIEGMRNPMNSWDKSDSGCTDKLDKFNVGDNDLALMKKLVAAGPMHCKFLRMLPIMMRINAPLFWWKEFDTYKVGTVSNSCSTMHKIQAKEFSLDDFSHEKMFNRTKRQLKYEIAELNYWRYIFLNGGGHDLPVDLDIFDYEDECLDNLLRLNLEPKAKEAWWQMIQILSSSYNQTRNISMNYEVCKNIYNGRLNHKMSPGYWDVVTEAISQLPLADELIIENKEDNNEKNNS